MEREEAIRDVEEIKRIMHQSRRRATNWSPVGIAVLGILLLLAVVMMPFLAPVVGIGMVVAGVMVYRRSEDSVEKALAAGAAAVGLMLVALTVLAVLGLMALRISGVEGGPVEPVIDVQS